MNNLSLIEVKAVSKTYRRGRLSVPALLNISFVIEPGEFVILVGSSGAGKTTLLNLLAALRQHLAMIAIKFSQGDFAIPMFIHARVPPGVETMKRLKSKITYAAENTARGAQLKITTHDADALVAVHCFLRF